MPHKDNGGNLESRQREQKSFFDELNFNCFFAKLPRDWGRNFFQLSKQKGIRQFASNGKMIPEFWTKLSKNPIVMPQPNV